MGGVMRPVGPEGPETYWMRRALVVGVMLVLLIIVLIFLFNLGGSPGEAAPAATQSAVPAGTPSSSVPRNSSATPSASAPASSASASASTSASSAPSHSAHPAASGTAKSSTKPSSKPSTKPSASASASDKPSSNASSKASSKPSSKPSSKASSKPSASAAPAAAACTSKQLWPSLRSSQHEVKVGSKITFHVSYINRSDQACSIKINPHSYELKIYSGSDRIWSTDDCASSVHSTSTTLKPGDAVVWSVTWNGKRSVEGKSCQSRPEKPGAGYYHATSKLKGAKGLQQTLVLT